MPDAVIASAARSPIGRANEGSLTDMRPDDPGLGPVEATRHSLARGFLASDEAGYITGVTLPGDGAA